MRRGDIYWADLGEKEGSLQADYHPVVIVSNNLANSHSSVITVIPATSKNKKHLPTHVYIQGCGLSKPSLLLAEQITSINKSKLIKKIGSIQQTVYEEKVAAAIKVQLSM